MEKSNIKYVKITALSGTLACPVLAYRAIKRLIKKERIKDSLEYLIEQAKEKSKVPPTEELTPVKIQFLRDLYKESNDFFSIHFKSDAAQGLSFDDKIEYCLQKYKTESETIYTATNILILENNFLNGARSTLELYFFFKHHKLNLGQPKMGEKTILLQINQTAINNKFDFLEQSITNNNTENIDRSVTNNNQYNYSYKNEPKVTSSSIVQIDSKEIRDFVSLFIYEKHYKIVCDFMNDHGLFPVNGKFERGNKRIFTYLLLGLMKKGIIPLLEGKQMSKIISNSFDDGISESTFSEVKTEGDAIISNKAIHYLELLYGELGIIC